MSDGDSTYTPVPVTYDDVRVCGDCHVLVLDGSLASHRQWHQDLLRQVLEELPKQRRRQGRSYR